MRGLGGLIKIQAILTIAIVGGVTYYLLKKRKKAKKSIEVTDISPVKASADVPKMSVEAAELECNKSMSHIRMTQQGKIEFIENCINNKIKGL